VEDASTSREGSIPSVEELQVLPGLGIIQTHEGSLAHWEGSSAGGEALGFQEPVQPASKAPDEGARGAGTTLTEGQTGLPPQTPASTSQSLGNDKGISGFLKGFAIF
jgi:hypothetical protein